MELTIYLIGVLAAYISMRKSIMYLMGEKWTVGDRIMCAFVSIFSMLGIFVAVLLAVIHFIATDERAKRPVKW